MTTSNVQSVYPNGVFPWVDKVDNQDIDFAANINSLAAEIESVETTVGTTPQIESSPPTGLPVSYSTVSSRISDAMNNAQLPYSTLLNSSMSVGNISSGVKVPFLASLDPYSCFNGNDLTIPAEGWWIITSTAQWSWWSNGYSHQSLTLNGSSNILDEFVLNWEFPGNIQPLGYTVDGTYVPTVIATVPPRWQKYGNRPIKTKVLFNGPLHSGDVISVYLENGTSNSFQTVTNVNLHAQMIRTMPASISFTSG